MNVFKPRESLEEGVATLRLNDDLPGEARGGALVEAGRGRRDDERSGSLSGKIGEGFGGGADFGEGGLFGFVDDGEFGEIGKGRESGGAAFFNKIVVEARVILSDGEGDDGVGGAKSLDNDRGLAKMAAADATDNLSEKLESFFFSGEIGEGEAGVGLDDTDRGETGKIETARDGLSADDELDFSRFDIIIERIEGF